MRTSTWSVSGMSSLQHKLQTKLQANDAGVGSDAASATSAILAPSHRGLSAWMQALPFSLVFAVFFVLPLLLILIVSFWESGEYAMKPALSLQSYAAVFEGCASTDALCLTFKTYLSTFKFSLLVWLITLVIGFAVAYFLAFCVQSPTTQTVLFIICTIPFWTSNVIRMISWVPLLGRNGLVNQSLQSIGLTDKPIDWFLFSEFSVVLAFVHLYTMFMIVPIFNSMMRIDRSLLDAGRDCGASDWQNLWNIVVPLSRTGIIIGSIFVITIVMGDFVTIGVMGGQQIASVGKIIQVQTSYLQFPLAAANAIILLAVVLIFIWALTRVVNIRKEL